MTRDEFLKQNPDGFAPTEVLIACIELLQEEQPHEVSRTEIDKVKALIRHATKMGGGDVVLAAGTLVENIVLMGITKGSPVN